MLILAKYSYSFRGSEIGIFTFKRNRAQSGRSRKACINIFYMRPGLILLGGTSPLDAMRLFNWREIATRLSLRKIGDIVNIHPKPAVHVATTNNEPTATIDLCSVVLSDI